MANSFGSFDDTINMSDITDRIDELREERDGLQEVVNEAREAFDDAENTYVASVENCAATEEQQTALDELAEALARAEIDLDAWDGADELKTLEELADELQGLGGDHQWGGDWYPGYLIRDSHFKDYAMELADDIGAIDSNTSWPLTCIDWDQAARELQYDYSSVEFDGVTYWCR